MTNAWVWDVETYPRTFTAAFEHVDAPIRISFEVSDYRNDGPQLLAFLHWLKSTGARMVGYNSVGFDWPVMNTFLKMGVGDAATLYQKAMAIIGSQDGDRFLHHVNPSDCYIPQVDLFKIHHFDNKAKATSLKMLEFNMRSDNIVDLPFPVGTVLDQEQTKVLREYNAHDVSQTKKFYHESKHMIAFRDELSKKYNRDFTNHNDTKIGKDYFMMELEKAGVQIYDYLPGKGRKPRQTHRPVIHLRDAILPWIQFERPEFQRVLDWMKAQSITETKGALKESYTVWTKKGFVNKTKDVIATVNGFDFVFGTGGIHGSIEKEIVRSDEDHIIIDLDVASYYPNLAIQNGFYPEHLGQSFVHIYKTLFEQRKKYPKKSAESQMLKLALNGVYGDSNNEFSVFYDPLFTMRITLNGQLLLCKLAEMLMDIPGLRVLQINTDGITVRLSRVQVENLQMMCEIWMRNTGLVLEDVKYKAMNIRDVNNYIAVREDGSTKRKGAYEWQAGGWYADGYNGWHQNASCPVVAKVAERILTQDPDSPEAESIMSMLESWCVFGGSFHDFTLRTKVPRSMRLEWGGQEVQRITRYVVTREGKSLVKVMPPLAKKPDEWRRAEVEAGWLVTVCNNIKDAEGCAIDYRYYAAEVEKLVMVLK